MLGEIRGGTLIRYARLGPSLVFLSCCVVFMPAALLGARTYAGVDLLELGSPYRDALGRPPVVRSPIQIDQTDELPWAQAFFDHLREGEFLDWDSNAGAGIPAGIFPLKGVMSPFSIAYLIAPGWYAVGLKIALSLLFCQAFTYLLLRRLGAGVWLAVAGAVAYTFMGANLVHIHRIGSVFVVPAMLWAMHRLVERPELREAGLVALFVGWSWFEGFPAGFAHSLYLTVAWGALLILRPVNRNGLRWSVRRAGVASGAVLLGFAVSAITLMPFTTEVTGRGILEERQFGPDTHLPPIHFFGLLDPKALGLYPEWVGQWWAGGNPVEAASHVGLAVAVAACIGLAAAVLGRLKLTSAGRTAWSFACGAAVLLLMLVFVGGPLLGAAYRLPGIAHNGIARARFGIGLALVVIAALAGSSFLRARNPDGEPEPLEPAPRLASAALLTTLGVMAAAAAPDYVRGLQQAGQGDIVKTSLAVNAALTVAIFVLMAIAGRIGRSSPRAGQSGLLAACGAAAALLLFVQLALPYRDFTPSAPVSDYYTEREGHRVLRDLVGGRYRFTASGRFPFNLNSGQVLSLPDLRAVGIHSREFRNLIEAIEPRAFEADPFRTIVLHESWDLASPLLNDLAVKYVALGTDEGPFGRVAEEAGAVTEWLPAADALAGTTFTAPGPVSGVVMPMRGNDACAYGHLTVKLTAEGATVAQSSRPSLDLISDWVKYALAHETAKPPGTEWLGFALTADALVPGTPFQLEVAASNRDCRAEIGADSSGPARVPAHKILVPDPAQRVRLVSTTQAWIYERADAWELVSSHARWRSFPSQEATIRYAAARGVDELDVVAYEGPPRPEPPAGAPAKISSIGREPGNVKFRTAGAVESLIVVSENFDDGWSATVDGNETTIVKVDGALLGVFVPPGSHRVELNFLPLSFRVGRWISLIALAVILVLLLLPSSRLRLRRREQS